MFYNFIGFHPFNQFGAIISLLSHLLNLKISFRKLTAWKSMRLMSTVTFSILPMIVFFWIIILSEISLWFFSIEQTETEQNCLSSLLTSDSKPHQIICLWNSIKLLRWQLFSIVVDSWGTQYHIQIIVYKSSCCSFWDICFALRLYNLLVMLNHKPHH